MSKIILRRIVFLSILGLMPIQFADSASAYYSESIANHNGSEMLVINNDGNVTIQYERPRKSIRKHGVRQGTVLFSGTISGNTLTGFARVFRRGCAPAQYNVSGPWNTNTGQIILRGASPKRVRGGCRVTGYTNSGSNAYLAFNIIQAGTVDHGGVAGAARPATCGWYVILTCHKNRAGAIAKLNNLGGEGVGGQAGAKVINTNNFSGFRNGFYCVADGPYNSRGAASSIAWKEAEPSAYVKKGC